MTTAGVAFVDEGVLIVCSFEFSFLEFAGTLGTVHKLYSTSSR